MKMKPFELTQEGDNCFIMKNDQFFLRLYLEPDNVLVIDVYEFDPNDKCQTIPQYHISLFTGGHLVMIHVFRFSHFDCFTLSDGTMLLRQVVFEDKYWHSFFYFDEQKISVRVLEGDEREQILESERKRHE